MFKKLFLKFSNKKKDNSQHSVKRISNAISINPANAQKLEDFKFDEFQQLNLENRLSELDSALETAEQKTQEFQELLTSLKNNETNEDNAESIIQKIIDSCDEISLNGIRLLAGDEINLNIRDRELNIKLPNDTQNAFGLNKDLKDINSAETKIIKLNEAILASKKDISNCKKDLDISKENIKSAGIDISSIEKLSRR